MTIRERPEETFVRQLKAALKTLGVSQRELAERLHKKGSGLATSKTGNLDQTKLSRLLSGKRAVFLNDVMEIASVLDVNPAELFVPQEERSYVWLFPKKGLHQAGEIRHWMRMEGPLNDANRHGYYQIWNVEEREIHEQQERAIWDLTRERVKEMTAMSPEELEEFRKSDLARIWLHTVEGAKARSDARGTKKSPKKGEK